MRQKKLCSRCLVMQRQDEPLGKILLEIRMKARVLDRVLNQRQRAEQPLSTPFATMCDEDRLALEMRARPERLHGLLGAGAPGSRRREAVQLEKVPRET